MGDENETIRDNLSAAGCTKEQTENFLRTFGEGNMKKAFEILDAKRDELLNEYHAYGKCIDCLDYLVYQLKKKNLLILLACLLLVGSANTVFAKAVAPKKINLNKTSLTLCVGETKNLNVKSVTPKRASKKVSWKTSNKKIVTVSKSGTVKGRKRGKATITAVSKINGKKAKCTVVVKENKNMQVNPDNNIFYIKVGQKIMPAVFEDNSSADAFRELLKKGDVTVSMSDYGNFEKVGSLGTTLPRNDTQITTVAGDVILYQGNSITIYYDKNSWSFTRLGKIEGATTKSMKEFLGDGTIEVVFSLNNK